MEDQKKWLEVLFSEGSTYFARLLSVLRGPALAGLGDVIETKDIVVFLAISGILEAVFMLPAQVSRPLLFYNPPLIVPLPNHVEALVGEDNLFAFLGVLASTSIIESLFLAGIISVLGYLIVRKRRDLAFRDIYYKVLLCVAVIGPVSSFLGFILITLADSPFVGNLSFFFALIIITSCIVYVRVLVPIVFLSSVIRVHWFKSLLVLAFTIIPFGALGVSGWFFLDHWGAFQAAERTSANALFQAAVENFNRGKIKDAKELLSAAKKINIDGGQIHVEVWKIMVSQEELGTALRQVSKANASPDQCQKARSQIDEHRKAIQNLSGQYPDQPSIHIFLGDKLSVIGDCKPAERHYRSAIAVKSSLPHEKIRAVRSLRFLDPSFDIPESLSDWFPDTFWEKLIVDLRALISMQRIDFALNIAALKEGKFLKPEILTANYQRNEEYQRRNCYPDKAAFGGGPVDRVLSLCKKK